MVDEYLSEKEQAEQLKVWLRDNWLWLMAGIVLGLGSVFGWRWWNAHQFARSQEAELQFAAMLAALDGNRAFKRLVLDRIVGGRQAFYLAITNPFTQVRPFAEPCVILGFCG